MASFKRFEYIQAWQKAKEITVEIYRVTSAEKFSKDFGLCNQIRRASVSIMANIAEGFKKRGRADKVRFMNIAQGSLEESRYYLILANDLNYGDSSQLSSQLTEVSKLLEAYSAKILDSEF